MLARRLRVEIERSLRLFPVVALIGSRQTGKSTLARAVAASQPGVLYLDLERPAHLARLADAELYLADHREKLVVIDEVQRRPELFPLLRALVDSGRRTHRFLLLGSASPALLRQSSESLAGRIVYHELPPLQLGEVGAGAAAARRLWERGGYPRSYLARSNAASAQWRAAFVATFLERDLPQLGIRVPAAQMRRFWQMLAHVHGQVWNASTISRSLGVSAPAVARYLAVLEDTFLVRRLQPYHANLGKRLIKSPKVYFRDSGLLHTLLDIASFDILAGHPALGASWEGFVIEQIVTLVPPSWRFYYFRTAAGAEVDLLLVPPGKPPVPVEIKVTRAPALSRGYHEAFRDLGCTHGFVVYGGDEAFPLTRDVEALPVTQLDGLFERRRRRGASRAG
jgi:predicted AAA+ superfamily ATPase